MKESELYEPVRELFVSRGYKVNAEVRDCDMTAVRGDELIVIELKRNLSVKLLGQALERQKTGAAVYVAIPKPAKYSPRKFRETLYVLKKLEVGLIFVNLKGEHSYAEAVIAPLPFEPVRNRSKERTQILKEIGGRALDTNVGGVTGRKIATAFTERCIHIACVLDKLGPSSPKTVGELTGADVRGLLYRNNYGWFDHPEKGVYAINDKCRREIEDFPELLAYYREKTDGLKAETK